MRPRVRCVKVFPCAFGAEQLVFYAHAGRAAAPAQDLVPLHVYVNYSSSNSTSGPSLEHHVVWLVVLLEPEPEPEQPTEAHIQYASVSDLSSPTPTFHFDRSKYRCAIRSPTRTRTRLNAGAAHVRDIDAGVDCDLWRPPEVASSDCEDNSLPGAGDSSDMYAAVLVPLVEGLGPQIVNFEPLASRCTGAENLPPKFVGSDDAERDGMLPMVIGVALQRTRPFAIALEHDVCVRLFRDDHTPVEQLVLAFQKLEANADANSTSNSSLEVQQEADAQVNASFRRRPREPPLYFVHMDRPSTPIASLTVGDLCAGKLGALQRVGADLSDSDSVRSGQWREYRLTFTVLDDVSESRAFDWLVELHPANENELSGSGGSASGTHANLNANPNAFRPVAARMFALGAGGHTLRARTHRRIHAYQHNYACLSLDDLLAPAPSTDHQELALSTEQLLSARVRVLERRGAAGSLVRWPLAALDGGQRRGSLAAFTLLDVWAGAICHADAGDGDGDTAYTLQIGEKSAAEALELRVSSAGPLPPEFGALTPTAHVCKICTATGIIYTRAVPVIEI